MISFLHHMAPILTSLHDVCGHTYTHTERVYSKPHNYCSLLAEIQYKLRSITREHVVATNLMVLSFK